MGHSWCGLLGVLKTLPPQVGRNNESNPRDPERHGPAADLRIPAPEDARKMEERDNNKDDATKL